MKPKRIPYREIRLDDKGEPDDIAIGIPCYVHIEAMSDTEWFIGIDDTRGNKLLHAFIGSQKSKRQRSPLYFNVWEHALDIKKNGKPATLPHAEDLRKPE